MDGFRSRFGREGEATMRPRSWVSGLELLSRNIERFGDHVDISCQATLKHQWRNHVELFSMDSPWMAPVCLAKMLQA